MSNCQTATLDPAMTHGAYSDEESRWAAVTGRDRRADYVFYFAVRTTGIYCRPSCPARTPKRTNVTFHTTTEEARMLGFRACKRCRPDESSGEALDLQVVTAVVRMIDAAIGADRPAPTLQEMADRAGFSTFHFHRLFKRVLGVTPKAYAAALRARRMEGELRDGESVTDAIYGAGYSSASRFYETAASRLGMAPLAHRRGGAGEAITYATAQTSLGLIMVAATERGICSIQFGEDEPGLVDDLVRRFPRAVLAAAGAAFANTVAAVVALVERPGQGAALPLDIRGTAFQERVWLALREIPLGKTASYADIATAIGQPTATRGVAQACAANPAAVAVPCHRVVRSDGALSGYRWGVERKAALLAREGAR